jgi:hypothetical protein
VPHTFFRIHPTSKLAGILRFSSKDKATKIIAKNQPFYQFNLGFNGS